MADCGGYPDVEGGPGTILRAQATDPNPNMILCYPTGILRHILVLARLFLRKLKTELKIPVLALVDSDPYGLKILSVYMKGATR